MTIDIRAEVTCSLGTLISGSINDDYVQGAGLIKTRGSVELAGIVTPAIGTAVTFSYTKGGTTRSIPRKLRVLSSFADPFRRTTKVELGCKLTYLADKQEKVDWTAFDDTANAGYTEDDARVITLPISAASVMAKCLTELGLTASSSPLTNRFSVAAFDLSGGYVNVLGDLLVSESYCGYLDASEVLQVFSLDQAGGTGPVLDKAKIVDLASIGVGQLPGEAVTVSYSSLKLQNSDAINNRLLSYNNSFSTIAPDNSWEKVESTNIFTIQVPYSAIINGQLNSLIAEYRIAETTTTTTFFQEINVNGEQRRVVQKRITEHQTGAPAIAGGLISEYLNNNITFNNATVYKNTYERYAYNEQGSETQYERLVEGSAWYVIGSLGLRFVFSPTDYVTVFWDGIVSIEKEVQIKQIAGDYQNVITNQYGTWLQTINGQQLIAAARDSFTNSSQVSQFINNAFANQGELSLLDSRVSIERRTEAQAAPVVQQTSNAANAKGGDPANNWRTASTSDLELALGSATAQRRIELSMPYAPDDVFTGVSGGPFGSLASDAPQKAKRFGIVQNRLLLGNRNGMNLQTAPELLPGAPFAPFIVQANGLSGLYRTNGTSWTLSSDGVIVSTDALFWGAVGGTGDFWFPVAPGITELPSTPPIVNGQMTVTETVPVWNEKALLTGLTRTVAEVVSLPYALQLTTSLTAVTKTRASVQKLTYVNIPAATITLAAQTPKVSTGVAIRVPAAAVAVAAMALDVASGASVAVPAAGITVAPVLPDVIGRLKTQILVPAAEIVIAGQPPALSSGGSVAVPVAGITLAGLVPKAGFKDALYEKTSVLLHFNGSNNATTFTDNGPSGLAITRAGDTKISTDQSVFGGASAYFDGSGDYLTLPTGGGGFDMGAGNFSIEARVRPNSVSGIKSIAGIWPSDATASWRFLIINDKTYFEWRNTDSTQENFTGTVSLTTNTWAHVVVTRIGSTFTLYVNGQSAGTKTSSKTIRDAASTLQIGRNEDSNVWLYSGYIDEMSIIKADSRYSAAFTPPTAAFPDA